MDRRPLRFGLPAIARAVPSLLDPPDRRSPRRGSWLEPHWPLDLLDRYSSIDEIEATPTILVHWRFFRNPPELFTCLHGDTDGLHFGLLLDDPARGFRGVAGYYSNDGDVIAEYKGLFHLLTKRIDERIEGAEEMIEDDPEYAADYEADIMSLRRLGAGLEAFLVDERIRVDEGAWPHDPNRHGARGGSARRRAGVGRAHARRPRHIRDRAGPPGPVPARRSPPCARGGAIPLVLGRSRRHRRGASADGPPTPSSATASWARCLTRTASTVTCPALNASGHADPPTDGRAIGSLRTALEL